MGSIARFSRTEAHGLLSSIISAEDATTVLNSTEDGERIFGVIVVYWTKGNEFLKVSAYDKRDDSRLGNVSHFVMAL